MKPVLEVRGLTKVFTQPGRPAFRAVDQLSFQLMPGEVLGIAGESGSGKSTAARLIARFIDPTAGDILINGDNVTRAKGRRLRAVYRELQMVFQTPAASFDPRRTLGDGIGESLRNRGASRAEVRDRVAETLERCGLPAKFAARYPHEVSGGQCQRAAIARALAGGPKALILDEATSSLDVTVQKQILELLTALRRTAGLSYLFICHDLALVQMLCDRVLVLRDGRIEEQGTPDDVILHPQSAYTRRLVEAAFS